MFLQSDKALSLVNYEMCKSHPVYSNKFGYWGLNVDYNQKEKKFQIYTNSRAGMNRQIQIVDIPLQ